jgi:hypothetical protein
MTENKYIKYLIIFLTLIISYYVTLRIDAPNYEMKLKRHTTIVDNNIEYPYKYRLINPYISHLWFTILRQFLPDKTSFLLAYFIQNFIVYLFLFYCVKKFFSIWFDNTGIAIGLLILAVLIPLSLTGYDVLGDMLTAGFMALGFYFININKTSLLLPLVFIAAFNELQIIILAAVFLLSKKQNLISAKGWLNFILLLVTFCIAYFLLYILRGGAASQGDVVWYFTKDAAFNIAHKDWILLWLIMITPFLPFVLKSFKLKPIFLRRTFLIILPVCYVISFFFIARMREIDKALTIFLILIPLALYTILPSHVKKEQLQN